MLLTIMMMMTQKNKKEIFCSVLTCQKIKLPPCHREERRLVVYQVQNQFFQPVILYTHHINIFSFFLLLLIFFSSLLQLPSLFTLIWWWWDDDQDGQRTMYVYCVLCRRQRQWVSLYNICVDDYPVWFYYTCSAIFRIKTGSIYDHWSDQIHLLY